MFPSDSAIFLQDSQHRAVVGSSSVPVLYDAPFHLAEFHESQVGASDPACTMAGEDIAVLGVIHGTKLTIKKVVGATETTVGAFEVIGVEPDGMGLTRLVLTKDS